MIPVKGELYIVKTTKQTLINANIMVSVLTSPNLLANQKNLIAIFPYFFFIKAFCFSIPF